MQEELKSVKDVKISVDRYLNGNGCDIVNAEVRGDVEIKSFLS